MPPSMLQKIRLLYGEGCLSGRSEPVPGPDNSLSRISGPALMFSKDPMKDSRLEKANRDNDQILGPFEVYDTVAMMTTWDNDVGDY